MKFIKFYAKLLLAIANPTINEVELEVLHTMDMIVDSKREKILKMVTVLRYAMLAGIVLTFIAWLLPYFTYPEADWGLSKGYKDSKSLWGIMLLPSNFLQMEKVMDIKYISLRQLHVVVIMAITGIIGIITCANKRGIAINIMPLIFSVWGLVGYFRNPFMNEFCNHPAIRLVQIVLIALTFVATIVSIVYCIMELKTRPADAFLSGPGE